MALLPNIPGGGFTGGMKPGQITPAPGGGGIQPQNKGMQIGGIGNQSAPVPGMGGPQTRTSGGITYTVNQQGGIGVSSPTSYLSGVQQIAKPQPGAAPTSTPMAMPMMPQGSYSQQNPGMMGGGGPALPMGEGGGAKVLDGLQQAAPGAVGMGGGGGPSAENGYSPDLGSGPIDTRNLGRRIYPMEMSALAGLKRAY